MLGLRFRRWWRVSLYGVVAVIAPFTVPSALDIPDAERVAVTAGWMVAALVYAALAWRTRGQGLAFVILDVITVVHFLLAALYEANWPAFRFWVTPAGVGGIWAATALGSSFRAFWHWQPAEATAPPQPSRSAAHDVAR